MGLNDTPSGERVQIAFFGVRNAGKSSLVNAVTGQQLAVVSDVAGTTTDPVRKAMELLPLGPVVIVDTPGFDDEGALGELRVEATRKVLATCDVAVLVVDAVRGLTDTDAQLLALFSEQGIPCVVALAKDDLASDAALPEVAGAAAVVRTSSATGEGIAELKETLARVGSAAGPEPQLIADLLAPGDIVVLVIPIDKAAPKGRLILPQQQVIRDVLEAGASALICRDAELAGTLAALPAPPRMVVTDSQAFGKVAKTVPADVPLTSFSILMARYKGLLDDAVKGVTAINGLKDGDKILIAEGCTHHRQCGDIGTVKIPKWLSEFTGKKLSFETASGTGYPDDLTPYALVVHCGGCMLNEREVRNRSLKTTAQGVPITNYGTMIAYVHGILKRSLSIFPELADTL